MLRHFKRSDDGFETNKRATIAERPKTRGACRTSYWLDLARRDLEIVAAAKAAVVEV
jgi:hypothetical protein